MLNDRTIAPECDEVLTGNDVDWLTERFTSLDLVELNRRAEMLSRLDNKYVLTALALHAALPLLAEHFDVLEINGVRDFSYDTCYFDDPLLGNYHDHQRGRRRRFKVRLRRYVESDLCFVEVKLKDKRGITVKKRLPYQTAQFGHLNHQALAYIEQAYRQQYQQDYGLQLIPQLSNSYRRITLVSKHGAERMTIDHALRFSSDLRSLTLPEVFVVETKSHNANGLADRILRSSHQHPVDACSKYCVGLSVTGRVNQCNRFLPALRRLGAINSLISIPRALPRSTLVALPSTGNQITNY
jgi:hypothetical protein